MICSNCGNLFSEYTIAANGNICQSCKSKKTIAMKREALKKKLVDSMPDNDIKEILRRHL